MNIKDSIGLRIKTERERQQMSREVLCLDGAELTVRQLIRIEKGESLPSLDRLSYIAKRLGKSMTELLDQDNITIPDEYYEMKNRLIKFPTYRNPDRIKSKLTLIEEVYEKFFDILPEEELLTLDILENILSFTSWEESPKVEEIYEDLFEQVKRKRKFSTNDLLIIDYYFFHLYGRKQYDKKLFERIIKRVLNQEIWTDDVYNIVLLYSYKPSVFVLKAKYELLHKENKKEAAENYDKAIMFASVLEDSVLEESIKAGKLADGL